MREFYKLRGIISSQESAVEEPFKYSLWPSEKSLVCLETFCLKNNPKGIKFRFVGCNLFLVPLSVRIFALLYNWILWEIGHGVVVEWLKGIFCNNELNDENLLNWINLFFIKIYNFETMRTEFFEKQNFWHRCLMPNLSWDRWKAWIQSCVLFSLFLTVVEFIN